MASETLQPDTFHAHTIDSLRRHVERWPECTLTIGNFDGVHLGHQSILTRVRRAASNPGTRRVAITFEPHPVHFFRPDTAPFRITTPRQKLFLLRRYGIELPTVICFDTNLSELEPEDFVRDVLCGIFRPNLIVVGYDFNFGKDRRGTPGLVRDLASSLGVEVEVQQAVEAFGTVVSSTRVRRAVRQGELAETRRLLGRPFALLGRVTPGAGRGRGLGFPTANIAPDNELLPAHGVYATLLEVGDDLWKAVTNVGVRPTFGEPAFAVETFVLDPEVPADLDLYGQPVAVHLLERLREERTFPTPRELAAQIQRDVAYCREVHERDSGADVVRQAGALELEI